MTDFNFFEPYIGSKRKDKENKFKVYLLVAIFILAITLPGYGKFKIMRAENQLQMVSHTITSSGDYQLSLELEEKTARIQEMEKHLEFLHALEEEVKQLNYIDDYLIYTIRDTIPRDLFLKEMNMDTEGIELKGIAKNKLAIAELEYSLRQVPYFNNLFIPTIQAEDGGYSFQIIFNLKGVTKDETK